jgi:hypothetical protein
MKVSAERKAKFIDALARGAPPEAAARSIGVDRRTANRWKAADPGFAEQWREAQDRKIELIEAVLFRQAMGGDLGAICFFLRANRPEIYNRRQVIALGGDPDAPPIGVATNNVIFYMPSNGRDQPEAEGDDVDAAQTIEGEASDTNDEAAA